MDFAPEWLIWALCMTVALDGPQAPSRQAAHCRAGLALIGGFGVAFVGIAGAVSSVGAAAVSGPYGRWLRPVRSPGLCPFHRPWLSGEVAEEPVPGQPGGRLQGARLLE